MKKILLVAVLALMAFSAKAQVYVGGNVGMNASTGFTQFYLRPEAGFSLNEKMSVGAVVGLALDNQKDYSSRTDFTLNPYFRYTFFNLGPVSFFADAEVALNFGNEKDLVLDTQNNYFNWGVGIRPGFAIPLTEKLSFVGHLGSVGYYYNAFSIDLDANAIGVGMYYSF